MPDVTHWLAKLSDGTPEAGDRLLDAIYGELRQLAQFHLARERCDHTLQATALAHEAYLRLADQHNVAWRSRAHFFAVASQAIRRILVDHARGVRRLKRGGDRQKLQLEVAGDLAVHGPNVDLLALDEALESLSRAHPDKVRVVEMKFFAGLSSGEIAELLEINTRTVERHWQFARAWLFRHLDDSTQEGAIGDDRPA